MPVTDLGFQGQEVEERRKSRSGGRRRRRRGGDGSSPDSLIHYYSDRPSSNGNSEGFVVVGGGGSLFSPAAGSLTDRCSFGSDPDAFFSALPLAGCERAGGGPPTDPDPEGRPSPPLPSPDMLVPSPCHSLPPPNSPRGPYPTSPFYCYRSQQLSWRCKSEAVDLPGRKPQRPQQLLFDFHGQRTDVSVLSPRFLAGGLTGMKKSSAASSRSRSGTFPSPGTPNYGHGAGATAFHKGWSSERVPLPTRSNRRYGGSGVLLPFTNGRTLPSKWEDAERWIFSPVSGEGVGRLSVPPSQHRRPKSKSGPLGAPAGVVGAYSSASPLVPCFDSSRVGNFAGNSPFMAGVLLTEHSFCGNDGRGEGGGSGGRCTQRVGGGAEAHSADGGAYIVQAAGIHGWSDMLIESSSSVPSSREGSTPTSPKQGPSSRSPDLVPSIEELESHFSKLEVRDVQVDDRVTVTRWSKKHIARGSGRCSASIIEWKKKTVEANTSGWEIAETTKSISK
ncbi:hypothetical protein B296_00014645 [Ensete ventricosum]|uniref:Remorin C-terminal domain-containing protein n=1 Tax=Ensete ventricosum TaxID=4639 RepID=A0A427ALH3_ENSVE|nr:hypothetical protein B296_00014645 [Ensete ventricosum]